MSVIHVVGAIIVRDGRVLLGQRRHDKALPYLWSTPGGKVEPGESYHAALRRELDEEVGLVDFTISALSTWSGEVASGPSTFFVRLFLLHDVRGEPTPREGQGLGWFTIAEMRHIGLGPADAAALDGIGLRVHGGAPSFRGSADAPEVEP